MEGRGDKEGRNNNFINKRLLEDSQNFPTQIASASQRKYPLYAEINRSWPENVEEFMKHMMGYSYLPHLDDLYAIYSLPQYESQLMQAPDTASINTHWVLHLSCELNDLAKIWEVATPILLEHQCPVFRCVKICNVEQNKLKQRNASYMQMSIYIPSGDEERYQIIIQQIEDALFKNGVKPTKETKKFCMSDRQIGMYSSVRFSGYGEPKKHLTVEIAMRMCLKSDVIQPYNVQNVKDPFVNYYPDMNKKKEKAVKVASTIGQKRGYGDPEKRKLPESNEEDSKKKSNDDKPKPKM